eukprot:363107-Chlamydomonas_euryale.AAC.4
MRAEGCACIARRNLRDVDHTATHFQDVVGFDGLKLVESSPPGRRFPLTAGWNPAKGHAGSGAGKSVNDS